MSVYFHMPAVRLGCKDSKYLSFCKTTICRKDQKDKGFVSVLTTQDSILSNNTHPSLSCGLRWVSRYASPLRLHVNLKLPLIATLIETDGNQKRQV